MSSQTLSPSALWKLGVFKVLCFGEPFLGPSSAWEFGAPSSRRHRSTPSRALDGSWHPRPTALSKALNVRQGFSGQRVAAMLMFAFERWFRSDGCVLCYWNWSLQSWDCSDLLRGYLWALVKAWLLFGLRFSISRFPQILFPPPFLLPLHFPPCFLTPLPCPSSFIFSASVPPLPHLSLFNVLFHVYSHSH